MRSAFFPVLILFICCQRAPRDSGIAHLKQAFARPEYIATGDGWAEARRRTLLKEYLLASSVPFREIQQAKPGMPHDKYKQVTIVVSGGGEKTGEDYPVTLSLVPGHEDELRHTWLIRQQQCDALLFAALERLPALRRQHRRILLTMDQRCHAEGLTARLGAVK